MSRIKKTVRNVVLIIVFVIVFLSFSTSRLTPLQAHRLSERSIHYGPSEVVEIFDHGDYQHILCKYDRWVSCNTVNRALLVLWTPGDQPTGFEKDLSEDINYSGSFSNEVNNIYGVVNNSEITKVELHVSSGRVLVQDELYDDLFYFSWESDGSEWGIEKIIGYNDEDVKIYEITR